VSHWRDSSTDAATLRNEAYRTGDNLRARGSIYGWRTEPLDFHDWVLDHVDWRGGERVLDIGCGPGAYHPFVRARGGEPLGVDLSEGMVAEAGGGAVASAQALPFGPGRFDVVLAAHMLYHLPDMGVGLTELCRVARPGGVVLVVTNGADHVEPLRSIMGEAGGLGHPVSENFLIQDGALLEPFFADVDLDVHRGLVEVPDLGPVLGYVESCRALDEPHMDVPWDEMMRRFAELAAAAIERDGCFRMTTEVGCFTCRP
jgi:SAM-dependent methyltransferase